MVRSYYLTKIFLGGLKQEIIEKYNNKISEQQLLVEKYKSGENVSIDAGFDLFVPNRETIPINYMGYKVNMEVKCSMEFIQEYSDSEIKSMPVGYYLYPRSSTGSKTNLRLSNSVGVIDAGYRGNIIALFDNINNREDVVVNESDRLVQICAPNITYPIYPIIVNNVENLGITLRGEGGFGSTGR
jgi:dUTP pyrophosphatase